MCNFPKTSHVCLLAGRSVMISSKVWKFHFNAPFGWSILKKEALDNFAVPIFRHKDLILRHKLIVKF